MTTGRASVRYDVWGGELPVVYVSAAKRTHIVFTGTQDRTWQVYTDLRPRMNARQRREGGFAERQPDWAFVVSNGTDEVSLLDNGEFVLSSHHRSSQFSTFRVVDKETADALRQALERYADAGVPEPTYDHVEIFAPIGSAVTYRALRRTFAVPVA